MKWLGDESMGSAAPPQAALLCPRILASQQHSREGLRKVQHAHLRRSTELSPGRGQGSQDKGLMERWEPHLCLRKG